MLQQAVEGRLSDEAFRGAIDPEILAIAAEETTDIDISARIRDVMDETLAAQQITRVGIDRDILRNRSIAIGNTIAEDVPDLERRKIFASTGLTTHSCLYLDEYVDDNRDHALRLMSGLDNSVQTAGTIGEIAAALGESEVSEAFSGSYLELLRDWMGGTAIPQIQANLGEDAPSVEQLAKFIEDYFGSRLPWVTSGFLRIATNRLKLEESDLLPSVRTLPAMIKAGVGFPEAAWAVAAGAASREAAIKIGADYISQRKDTVNTGDSGNNYAGFLEWLRPLTSEDLHHLYGLEGAVLEDTVKAFQRSTRNPLLATEEALPLEFDVRGTTYEGRWQLAALAVSGSEVFLRRDYDNLVDRNAVYVTLDNQPIGYAPKDFAQLMAPNLDSGWIGKGKVIRRTGAPIPSIRVKIEA